MTDPIPHITVDIDTEARTKVEAHGFKGGECLAATMEIEQALGRVATRSKKREFFERAVSTVRKLRVGQ